MGRSLGSIKSVLKPLAVCAPVAWLALAVPMAQGQAQDPATPKTTTQEDAAAAKSAAKKPADPNAPAPVTHSPAPHASAADASPPNESPANAPPAKPAGGPDLSSYGSAPGNASGHPDYLMPPVDAAIQPYA